MCMSIRLHIAAVASDSCLYCYRRSSVVGLSVCLLIVAYIATDAVAWLVGLSVW